MWIFNDVQTTLRLTRQSNSHTSNCKNQMLASPIAGGHKITVEAARPISVKSTNCRSATSF